MPISLWQWRCVICHANKAFVKLVIEEGRGRETLMVVEKRENRERDRERVGERERESKRKRGSKRGREEQF